MGVSFKIKGDLKKAKGYLEGLPDKINIKRLEEYGEMGVEALKKATPIDTGKTAESWRYEIRREKDQVRLVFINSNVVDGIPVVILLQYGHATRNGGYVYGTDFINPVTKPIFDKLADDAWREVTKV